MLNLVPKWLSDPLWYFPAIWNNDVLIGAMLAKESSGNPSWSFGHWVSKGNLITTLASEQGVQILRLADKEIFDEMEIKRKLNRIYVSYRFYDNQNPNVKNIGMSDRLFTWMTRNNYRVARYKFFTDCIVDAGESPKYAYQKELLGNTVWPFKTAVRIGFLVE
jgi:hypothetical protein